MEFLIPLPHQDISGQICSSACKSAGASSSQRLEIERKKKKEIEMDGEMTGINNVKCDWRKSASSEVSRSERSNLLCCSCFSAEPWLDKTRGVRKGKKSLSEHLPLHILLNPFSGLVCVCGRGGSALYSGWLLSDQRSPEVRGQTPWLYRPLPPFQSLFLLFYWSDNRFHH